jgi:hypothetical protein
MGRKYRYEVTEKGRLELSQRPRCARCGHKMVEGISLDGRVFRFCMHTNEHLPTDRQLTMQELISAWLVGDGDL